MARFERRWWDNQKHAEVQEGLGLTHKSVEELLQRLARLTERTKATFTEKDIAVFQHVNSIEVSTRNAQTEVAETGREGKAVAEAIGGLIR